MAAGDTGDAPNTLTIAAPGVLAGAYDPDGDTMVAELVSGPADGTLTLNQDGSFEYTPNAGFSGTDSFTFVVSDQIKQSAQVKATVVSVLGDLNAATIQNNAASGVLAQTVEDTTGAFVPIDNVDQNYDGTPDMADAGPIQGEKDLLPITLKAGSDAKYNGMYTLDIPANIRVWQNPDRSGNDTNGDGTPDLSQSPVEAFTDPNGNVLGRDEVDLMQLVVNPPAPIVPGLNTVTLSLTPGLDLWRDPQKVTAYAHMGDPGSGESVNIDITQLPMTLYIEAVAQSSSLRDMGVQLEYNNVSDLVHVTSIWAMLTGEASDTWNATTVNQEFGDMDELLQSDIQTFSGTGMTPIKAQPIGVRN
ncbi:MAG: hypothetical protein B7Z73_18705, partial [Planctomycetia bacterium 21-64-5]